MPVPAVRGPAMALLLPLKARHVKEAEHQTPFLGVALRLQLKPWPRMETRAFAPLQLILKPTLPTATALKAPALTPRGSVVPTGAKSAEE